MGDLAARLGCSYRTLYSLAPSRQELVLVVIDRILRAKGRAALEVLSECHDPATRLEALIEIWAGDFDRISLRYAEDAAGHPAVTRLQNDHQDHAFLILRDVIEDGIASGQFRPMHARIAADVINAGLARIRDPEVLREAGVTPQQAVAELLALILRGFGEGPR
jgi:AcrR family transcriptional regulator